MSSGAHALKKKVCLLGDFSVGKTSLVRRFVEGRFDERYLSTIGVKVDQKVLNLETPRGDVTLTLLLWDLAGGPSPRPVVPGYYRGAAGAVIACDLTRADTLASVPRYAQDFLASNPAANLVLVANKLDLIDERRLTDEVLVAAASECRAPLFLTSAKSGEQVQSMFEKLGQMLVMG